MSSFDIPIETLILPGLNGSPDSHWQRHWARDNPDSRVLEQDDWTCPVLTTWMDRLEEEIARVSNDVWLVGHSLGCLLAARLASSRFARHIRGALLVAPCDMEATEALHPCTMRFGAMPSERLPFPTLVVGSLNDPYMPVDRLRRTAKVWGADLIDIGAAGHINIASGFGRWSAGYDFLELLKARADDTNRNARRRPPLFSSALAAGGIPLN